MKIFLLLTVLAFTSFGRFYNHVEYGEGPCNGPDYDLRNDNGSLPQAQQVNCKDFSSIESCS